jgi:hypothetical protein
MCKNQDMEYFKMKRGNLKEKHDILSNQFLNINQRKDQIKDECVLINAIDKLNHVNEKSNFEY